MKKSIDFLGKTVDVVIDRPLGSAHPKYGYVYPINYGYVPDTVSGDGKEIDAYILGIKEPLATFTGECVAVIRRMEEDDDKLIVVPIGTAVTDEEIKTATYFQEQFFSSKIVRRSE